jgi:hypothetical protein
MRYDPNTTRYLPTSFKTKLHELVKKFGVPVSSISKELNISVSSLSGMMKTEGRYGDYKLWEPDLKKILELFHVSVEDFRNKPVDQLYGAHVDQRLLKNKKPKQVFHKCLHCGHYKEKGKPCDWCGSKVHVPTSLSCGAIPTLPSSHTVDESTTMKTPSADHLIDKSTPTKRGFTIEYNGDEIIIRIK